MQDVEDQKIRLEQKKNRLAAEETRLKLKERKIRTRRLIELGGLVVKAELDHLPTNTLYGSLLSLGNDLKQDFSIKAEWTKLGKTIFDQEQQQKIAVILKLTEKPSKEIRDAIRSHSLKWNRLREEWYGYVTNLPALKDALAEVKYDLQIIKDSLN